MFDINDSISNRVKQTGRLFTFLFDLMTLHRERRGHLTERVGQLADLVSGRGPLHRHGLFIRESAAVDDQVLELTGQPLNVRTGGDEEDEEDGEEG